VSAPPPAPPPFEDSLAGLISRLGADAPSWDRAFTRRLAAALAEVRDRLVIGPTQTLGLGDLALTFRMTEVLSVVITGRLPGVAGAWTWHLRELELADVPARIAAEVQPEPWLVCTVDESWRGRVGVLRERAGPLPPGQRVVARALCTVNGAEEVRVRALGLSASVAPEGVMWHTDAAPPEGDA
jgi:hypothetical protein